MSVTYTLKIRERGECEPAYQRKFTDRLDLGLELIRFVDHGEQASVCWTMDTAIEFLTLHGYSVTITEHHPVHSA